MAMGMSLSKPQILGHEMEVTISAREVLADKEK